MGGGAAGLTLALQLRKARPGTSILVVERQEHPVPEATHKVGESTVEIAAFYLREVLGLGEHLKEQQLNKFGLRIFFSNNGNEDITRRVELGHAVCPPHGVGTYQIDRGRLENALGEQLRQMDIEFSNGSKVSQVRLEPEQDLHHLKVVTAQGEEQELAARWVIDATGRACLLKRQLGLAKRVTHEANAVWFRIGHPIDINQWSDDPAWQARIREGRRELSTNHLMGPGYWVWLIRLASDSISIGIVTDANMHEFTTMNKFDKAMEWLHEHEPQCARVIEQHRHQVRDFRVMKDYSYSCEQVFSNERWCLAGEAGVFLDPFYSPGLDLIAISNGLITDLVTRGLDGEDIEELAAIHNQIFLIIANGWLRIYDQQYGLMGNARIMLAKVIWDTAVYWAVPGLLFFHDAIRRLSDFPKIVTELARFTGASEAIQVFFREWLAIDHTTASDTFISFYDFDFMKGLHIGMTAGLSDDDLAEQFTANVRFIQQISGQMVHTVLTEYEGQTGDEAIERQVAAWKNDSALMELVEVYQQDHPMQPVSDDWITLRGMARVRQEAVR
jgi:2-polyprenyl-6-methoxyphenol hydroxylase-like FAD-dependent oxidoreductase